MSLTGAAAQLNEEEDRCHEVQLQQLPFGIANTVEGAGDRVHEHY